MDLIQDEYDEIAYPTFPRADLHPDRQAILGRLFGLETAPVEHSRTLEIACGDGSNLIPIAAALPGAEFVGIDLSEQAINKARQFSAACGLRNLRLDRADIREPSAIQGQFDFILCHGLYSWVPPDAREAILRCCAESLSERGLAMISYNAFPGSHNRLAAREMLLWHMRQIQKRSERLEEGIAFAQFLGKTISKENLAGQALAAECSALVEKTPGVFFHDELAPLNQPFYFHEFMAAAQARGLDYVCDSDLLEYVAQRLDSEGLRLLAEVADGRIEREQYLDFLVSRRFRQTILCRAGRTVAETPQPLQMRDAYFAAGEDLQSGPPGEFFRPNGPRLKTTFAPGIEALQRLVSIRPLRVHFPDLTHDSPDPDAVLRFLFEASKGKFVSFHATSPNVAAKPGPKPQVFASARVQAAAGLPVTNIYHRAIEMQEDWVRELLARCDGKHDVAALLPGAAPEQAAEVFSRLSKLALFIA